MPLTAHQTLRFYDPRIDADAIRISGFSGRGEFWIKEALAPAGAKRREQKERALDLIEQAIEAGLEPGEVVADD